MSYQRSAKIDIDNLIATLHFINDKVEDCYKRETTNIIRNKINYLEDCHHDYLQNLMKRR